MTPTLRSALLACALCAAAVPALAQDATKQAGDPARWYRGANTEQQRLQVLKKEIGAAYAQQQAECRRQPASSRGACLKEARQVYRDDMKNAPTLVAQAPSSEVRERVLGPADSGATAVGGSSAGATGSGGADMPSPPPPSGEDKYREPQSSQPPSSQSQSSQPPRVGQPPSAQPPVER